MGTGTCMAWAQLLPSVAVKLCCPLGAGAALISARLPLPCPCPLPQDDQGGPEELPRAYLQRARGRRADEGAARWVPGWAAALLHMGVPLAYSGHASLWH